MSKPQAKATLVKQLDGFTGDARLYKLTPPLEYEVYGDDAKSTEYVVASATNVMFSGPETYLFAASPDGEILDWLELPGSFRGGLDHERALRNAGYSL